MKILSSFLIPAWEQKIQICYFCGTNKSVKYTVNFQTDNGVTLAVCCCNKCRAIYF